MPGCCVLFGIVFASCSEPLTPSAPLNSDQGTRGQSTATQVTRAAHPSDDFAVAVPGFGGVFVEGDTLVVWVKGTPDITLARGAAAAVLQRRGRKAMAIGIRQGDFSFDELGTWRYRLREVLGSRDVVGSAIDERRNRIRVDVATPAAANEIALALGRLSVPTGAVDIRRVPHARLASTLSDRVRPLKGGLFTMTTWSRDNFIFGCTYGFNVRLTNRIGERFMLTSSHCTQRAELVGLGGQYSAKLYQGTAGQITTSNLVATEYLDPPFDRSIVGCPVGRTCRYTDIAMMQLTTSSWALGRVSRPVGGPAFSGFGSLTLACDTCSYVIETWTPYMIAGDTISKIGRVSGWTAGTVADACYDLNVATSSNTVMCTVAAFLVSREGDSGAPAFWRLDGCCGNGPFSAVGLVFATTIGADQSFISQFSRAFNEFYPYVGSMDVAPDPFAYP